MKKFFIVIFAILIIVLLIINNKQQKVQNNLENVTSQSGQIENKVENKVENEVKNETVNVILNENTAVIENTSKTENATTNQKQEKNLDGKTIAFIGDSLIEGYGNDNKGFDYYLKQYLPNNTYINNSKSGSTITDNSGNDNIVMINQAKSLNGNPDMIIFDGGANDIIGYALGFLNTESKKDIGSVDMSTQTVSEGDSVINDFEEVVLELKNRFPNAELYYIQPFLLDSQTISYLTNDSQSMKEIRQRRDLLYSEIQKMCIKWNIKYIDLTESVKDISQSYRQSDWIHINENGYKILTENLYKKLKEN